MSQTVANNSIWVTHPTGNANVRATLEAFENEQLLHSFHTCLGVGNDAAGTLSARLFKQRTFPIPAAKITTQPYREGLRLLLSKRGWLPSLYAHEVGALSVDHVYHALDRAVAERLQNTATPPQAMYCYEDGAASSFAVARSRQVRCLYDLPIGYWRTARSIQTEESQRLPEWAATMPALIDSTAKLERKDVELQQADHIIVASQFTARTLQDAPFPLAPITIIPYGCPTVGEAEPPQTTKRKQPLRVLYVGGLSQRKGLSYLLKAVALMGDSVEVTLIGKRVAECAPLDAALNKYRWIDALPHAEILQIMREHDVFVFPSLFEGFGLVLTEALSQGLPIISTAHTCAPDIIEDGKEGFIVPIRDAEAIAEKLEWLHTDRDRLATMKVAASEKAKQTTWHTYAHRLVQTVSNCLQTTP